MSETSAPAAEINTTGRVLFVRDADGELHVVKPGQPLPVVAPPEPAESAAAAEAGEKDNMFSSDAPRKPAKGQKKPDAAASAGGHAELLAAARKGDDDTVRAACQADEEVVHGKDHLERTALHLAAYAGHLSTIELLLAFGARHSPLACDAVTPLHMAAQNGHPDACKLLLKAGAKVNARGTKRNDTPLHLCAFKGHLECLEYLLRKGADAGLKNRLLKTPADVAASDEIREALLAAAQKKRPEKKKERSPAGPAVASEGEAADEGEEPSAKAARVE